MTKIKTWDIFIRFFHWSVVVIILADFTIFEEGRIHEMFGYIMLGLLGLRFIWGFIGDDYARFSRFFPTIARIKRHLNKGGKGSKGRESTYHGHNPIGALMIFNLYLTLLLLGLSGYLATTDRFWGVEWVEEVHEFFANYLLFSVTLHVVGVLWESRRSGINLISAMITGIKKVP